MNLKQGRGDSASRAKENGTSRASATPQDSRRSVLVKWPRKSKLL